HAPSLPATSTRRRRLSKAEAANTANTNFVRGAEHERHDPRTYLHGSGTGSLQQGLEGCLEGNGQLGCRPDRLAVARSPRLKLSDHQAEPKPQGSVAEEGAAVSQRGRLGAHSARSGPGQQDHERLTRQRPEACSLVRVFSVLRLVQDQSAQLASHTQSGRGSLSGRGHLDFARKDGRVRSAVWPVEGVR